MLARFNTRGKRNKTLRGPMCGALLLALEVRKKMETPDKSHVHIAYMYTKPGKWRQGIKSVQMYTRLVPATDVRVLHHRLAWPPLDISLSMLPAC